MGVFLEVILFPGGKEEQCRAALARCPLEPEMNIQPGECVWRQFAKGAGVLLNDGGIGYDLPGPLSRELSGPVMLLYIYDDDYWGYELWRSGAQTDQFASLPNYFEMGQPPDKPGNALAVAEIFGVEAAKIAGYLSPWAEEEMGGFAYPDDEFVVGDSWQLTDFMAALGFDYDCFCPEEPEPELAPEPAPVYVQTAVYKQPIDTPILPDALNSREYAMQRAAELGAAHGELVLLLQNGQYEKALPLLTAAIQTTPGQPVFYLLRAFCWSQLECLTRGRNRRPDMDRDLSSALALEPDNIMALRAHCPTTATSQRYQRHIRELTRLMELDPENVSLYQVSRAYRWHWVGDDEAARADLQAVLERGDCWTVDLVYLCGEFGMPGF